MKILKKYLLTLLLPILVLFAAAQHSCAQTTYDWRPSGTSTAWASASNWQSTDGAGTHYPAATYPGLTASDIVRIGVNTGIAAFSYQPAITTNVSYNIASLTFGNNNAAFSATGNLSLAIGSGSTLTVSGTVLQMHSSTGGAANSGGRDTVSCYSCFTTAITTSLVGPGTLHCGYFTVGDNTVPGNAFVNDYTDFTIGGSVVINVDHDFTLNSATYYFDGDSTVISRNSDVAVSFRSGTLTINGQLKATNYNPYNYVVDQYIPNTGFSMDLTGPNNAVLNLNGTNAINVSIGTFYCTNSIDFYNPAGGSGQSTVNYASAGDQEVYDYQSYPIYAIDPDPYMYQNVAFGGSGTKTFDLGTTTLGGNLILNPGTEVVDLSVNTSSITLPGTLSVGSGSTLKGGAGAISVTGAVTNAGTITLGSGNFSMANNFTNSGTFNCGSSTVIFNSTGATQLNDSTPGGTI
ncbi:MAG: hypothetical protein JSU01_04510, partial [Bacteroidetes bacterium]|nr:hypothetical protein [Bacteroidota bacterium]